MRGTAAPIRLAALLLSLGAHGAVFYHFADRPLTSGGAPQQGELSRVTLRFAPEPEEAEAEPEAAPEPVLEPDPEPEPEPPPPPPPKPKPKPAPKPKPKPTPKPKPKPPKVARPTPAPKPAAAAVQAAPAPAPVAAAAPRAADPALREAYLARLLAYIEGFKEYPRIARRRRIEGRVDVAFRLTARGGVEALTVAGGHRSLRQAAREAVERAAPLPRPASGSGVELPLTVRYAMEFRLR
ncbi:TonB family protein [Endothiovibrio diazotrophicus]